ncbi:ATP-binding protein [Streptomyces sp. NPDC093225]|uniref:ATP-binding protein n=1 Tax=Streptomyces sp. NPDC093225 TaxID=3366034 RepID=UPI00380E6C54
MISHRSRHCAVELQALPARIGQVRRIVSAQLRYWQLDPLIDRAALGVTELLSNVHRHARPDKSCTVELELRFDRLTISVRDADPRLPQVRASDLLETSGRGLALVEAVSESWGARPLANAAGTHVGKLVWFVLPVAVATPTPLQPVRILRPEPGPATAPAPVLAPAAEVDVEAAPQRAPEPARSPALVPS